MAIVINAETRTDLGKGASRRLRHQEKIPAILYGSGDPVNLTIDLREVRPHVDNEVFYSSIVSLKVGKSKAEKVIVRDLQHHPYKVDIMHIDFQRVDAKKKMHINVPLHFVGEEVAPGVKQQGGLISHTVNEVAIECLPKDIPEFIEVDVSELNSGESIHLTELKMPKGVTLLALTHGDENHDTAVVSIHAPKVSKADEEADAAESGGADEEPAAE